MAQVYQLVRLYEDEKGFYLSDIDDVSIIRFKTSEDRQDWIERHEKDRALKSIIIGGCFPRGTEATVQAEFIRIKKLRKKFSI